MLKENKSGDAGQEHFLGAFHNNTQKSPRLGQSTEQAQGCPGSQPARKCSILTFQLICWFCIDKTFEEQRGVRSSIASLKRQKKSTTGGRGSLDIHFSLLKSVFGPKRRKSRPSAMLTDSKAQLGSTGRSWHTALGHMTDKCPARGQSSLFVLNHRLTPLPVQAKKHHQGLSASCFQKFFQTEGKSVSHHYWELPLIQLLPLTRASAFLEGTWHSLKPPETQRQGYSSERDRGASSDWESPLALLTALAGCICDADRLCCSSAKTQKQSYHQLGNPPRTAEEKSGRRRIAWFSYCACLWM